MLQPLQLKDVSLRYAHEIAELQDFLQKSGCLPGEDALYAITLRLAQERAFHRDLTSHLWVVIHVRQNISYADLLGILAIAAAGIDAAADAEEEDAHILLGFLMEAKESLGTVRQHSGMRAAYPATSTPATASAPPSRPLQRISSAEQATLRPPATPSPSKLSTHAAHTEEEEETTGSSRRLLWVVACVFAALALGLGLHHLSSPTSVAAPVPEASVSPATAAPATPAPEATVPQPSALPQPSAPAAEIAPTYPSEARPAAPAPRRNAALRPPTASQRRAAKPPVAARPPAASAAPTPTITAAAAPPPAPSAASSAPVFRAAPAPAPAVSHAALTPTPSAKNGIPAPSPVHLNATPAYTESATPDLSKITRKHPVPRLRVRTPQEKAELLAEISGAPSLPAHASPATPATPHGTVRADSIGAYAANTIYSPVPDYPPAAYAAHVQGEVKLQSEVDRDGNVTSVRLVSGQPLLRDAALDAAQRWRYRPNTINGRQFPMTTITVFTFQLP